MGNLFSKQENLDLNDFTDKLKEEDRKNKEILEKKKKMKNEKLREKKEKVDTDLAKNYLTTIKKHSKNKETQKIKKKDLIIIIGNTGSGKSTLINYLLGAKLVKIQKKGSFKKVIIIKKNQKIFSPIGHNFEKSETENIKYFENENFNLLDTQGFFDSRGIGREIGFLLLLEDILENSGNLKIYFYY